MQINPQPSKYNVLRNDKLFESLMVCFSYKNSDKMRITIFSPTSTSLISHLFHY